MNTSNLIRQFREEPKSVPDFKVQSVTDRESYDMIWKAGYMEALNHLEVYVAETMGVNRNWTEWIEGQRKTLNKYL